MEKVMTDYLKIVLITIAILSLLQILTIKGIIDIEFRMWVPFAVLFLGAVGAWIYGKTGFAQYFFIGLALLVGGFLVFIDFWVGYDQQYVGFIIFVGIAILVGLRLFNKSIEKKETNQESQQKT